VAAVFVTRPVFVVEDRVSHARCAGLLFILLVLPNVHRSPPVRSHGQAVLRFVNYHLSHHRAHTACLPVKYIPSDNELLESEDLEIVGEDPENAILSTGTVPVRTLTGFSVFDKETNELVSLGSLLVPRDSPDLTTYCAVGYVLPAMENAVEDVEEMPNPDLEDCQIIRLSTIRAMSLFDLDDDCEALDKYSYCML